VISTMTRAEERVIADLCYIIGGEAALERAIRSFVRVTGRVPTGDELLDHVADTRIAELTDEIARREWAARPLQKQEHTRAQPMGNPRHVPTAEELDRLSDAVRTTPLHPLALQRVEEVIRLERVHAHLQASVPERLARVRSRAEQVFGDASKAWRWLRAWRGVLNAVPLDLIETEDGAARVEQELERIAYGIYG
jgi:hypothetical protein